VFKAELTRAKQNYIKHCSIPKFEPTNIVPLTNISFSQSFPKAENVKKVAIVLTRDETAIRKKKRVLDRAHQIV
jgi:hypothetical protein